MNKLSNEQISKIGLKPEFVGITAMNPFANHNSSSRSIMMASHTAQSLTLINGEEKIIQSGLEREFGRHTFNKVIKNDSRVISIIPRYRSSLEHNTIGKTVDAVVIFEDLTTNEIDYLELPKNSKFHTYFGFEYNWNNEVIGNLTHNDTIPAGTILASSPAVDENNGYKYGINFNVCMMSINETAEDGVIISETAAKKLGINLYERRTVEFGSDSMLLNLYGDKDNYKPFPDIGENIHETGAIVAIRKFEDDLSPALLSKNDILEFDPLFDMATYVRGGKGEVTDIKVYHTPKNKKEVLSNTDALVSKYTNGLIQYHKDILDVYDNIVQEHKDRYHNTDVKVSPRMTRLIVDSMALTDSDSNNANNIKKVYRNDQMDIYRIEFTIKYFIENAKVGYKISDSSGGKSIVCEIRKDEDMPRDKNGVYADIISDPGGTIGRMNIGRLYEGYLCKASREAKRIIENEIIAIDENNDFKSTIRNLSKDMAVGIFSTAIEFLKSFDTEQYKAYSNIRDVNIIKDILIEIVEKELYVYYGIDSKDAYKVVEDINKTKFRPTVDKVTFNTIHGQVQSKEDIIIAPMYIIMLAKIADTWLATPSAKFNHFGLPTSASKTEKNLYPWKSSATKTMSETEARLYSSYADIELLAELKNKGSSLIAHEEMYRNIMLADNPMAIEEVIDRSKLGYGGDKAMEISLGLMNCAGFDLAYTKNDEV